MKAYIFSEKGKIEPKELPEPMLDEGRRPGDSLAALLKPLYLSPCSSDVHTVYAGKGPRRPDIVLGHEGIAMVTAVGSKVKDFSVGEIVVPSAVMPERGDTTGHAGSPFSASKLGRNIDGMWAERFYVPEADINLAKLPLGLSMESALMAADMMATGATAAAEADIAPDMKVLIIGSGAVGLMAAFFAARAEGVDISMTGTTHDKNIEIAKAAGVRNYISYRDGSVIFGESYTPGDIDRVIIAGGGKKAFIDAFDIVRYGTGRIVNVSYIEGEGYIELPIFSLGRGMSGKTIKFCLSRGGRAWIEEMLKIAMEAEEAAGEEAAPRILVTHRLDGFDMIPKGLEMMKERPGGLVKIMIDTKL